MGGDYQMMGCNPQVMGDCNGMSPANFGLAGQQSPFAGQMSPFGQQVQLPPADFSMGQVPWEDPMQMQHMPQPDPMQIVSAPLPPQQISPSNCQQMQPGLLRDLSHEEMMATVIPAAAYGLDREQLAQQLRAAAQCIDSYED